MKGTTMICATCSKTPVEKTIATKTRKVGANVVVEAQRQALVCDCGILCWDPPKQAQPAPFRPYPLVPVPATPYQPYVSPNSSRPMSPSRPHITC